MNAIDLMTALRRHAVARDKVRVTRSVPTERLVNGFVAGVGETLAMYQVFHDFYPEGLSVFPTAQVEDVRCGLHEEFWKRVAAAEGIDPEPLPDTMPSLDSISGLLTDLGRDLIVIIRCEDMDEAVEDFYIGYIVAVEAESVSFANFDALGEWDAEVELIPMNEITRVEFQTPYIRTLSRHLNGPCPHL